VNVSFGPTGRLSMASEVSATWVTKSKASEATGLTIRQIESRIQRRVWKRGEQYVVADGTTMINLKAVDDLHNEAAGLCRESSARTPPIQRGPTEITKLR
jgi:hypothetical protein